MPVEIVVEEERLSGFSQQAREHLRVSIESYATALIAEAGRLEAGHNPNGASPEITQPMVRDAALLVTHGLARKQAALSTIVARIAAAVMPLLVGILYNSEKLQSPIYMAGYVFVIILAVIAITASVVFQ